MCEQVLEMTWILILGSMLGFVCTETCANEVNLNEVIRWYEGDDMDKKSVNKERFCILVQRSSCKILLCDANLVEDASCVADHRGCEKRAELRGCSVVALLL